MTIREQAEIRLQPPPSSISDYALRTYLHQISDHINGKTRDSVFSYDTPESNVTASPGTLGMSEKSDESRAWVKLSGDTNTGWASLLTSGNYSELSESAAARSHVGYAGVHVHAGGVTLAFDDNLKIKHYDVFQDVSASSLVTPDKDTPSFTVTNAGDYYVAFNSSMAVNANAQTFHWHVYLDGTQTEIGAHRKLANANDVGAASASGILTCAASSVLTLGVQKTAGSGTPTLTTSDAEFSILRVD